MKTYQVEISETLSLVVEVQANSEEEAFDNVIERQVSGDIELLHSNDTVIDTNIELVKLN